MNTKTQLHKIKPFDVAVALIGITMAILTFVKIPFGFILGFMELGFVGVYLLACIGLFNDKELYNE